MGEIDSVTSDHVNTEQTFLSATLAEAEGSMTKRTDKFRAHLAESLKDSEKIKESVKEQQTAVDEMISAIKQHVS